jgi:hypothetical protein
MPRRDEPLNVYADGTCRGLIGNGTAYRDGIARARARERGTSPARDRRGFEIDHQLELRRLFDRKVSRTFSANSAGACRVSYGLAEPAADVL